MRRVARTLHVSGQSHVERRLFQLHRVPQERLCVQQEETCVQGLSVENESRRTGNVAAHNAGRFTGKFYFVLNDRNTPHFVRWSWGRREKIHRGENTKYARRRRVSCCSTGLEYDQVWSAGGPGDRRGRRTSYGTARRCVGAGGRAGCRHVPSNFRFLSGRPVSHPPVAAVIEHSSLFSTRLRGFFHVSFIPRSRL